jgi:hypothetical protein
VVSDRRVSQRSDLSGVGTHGDLGNHDECGGAAAASPLVHESDQTGSKRKASPGVAYLVQALNFSSWGVAWLATGSSRIRPEGLEEEIGPRG